LVHKANILKMTSGLFLQVGREIAQTYPDIEFGDIIVDNCAMQLVRDPTRFDVVVTTNLFGDIITDLGAAFQGGLGMAASGNLHPGRTSMFEPVHGSAPPLAGKNIANPIGAISSVALMLETLGLAEEATAIDLAILAAVNAGEGTADVGGTLGTREAGSAIVARLTRHGNMPITHKEQTGERERGS
jgi:3-isopropylmalate dehydrogenase